MSIPHISCLRFGKSYRSFNESEVKDYRDGSVKATLSQVNAGIIRRDLREINRARDALNQFSTSAGNTDGKNTANGGDKIFQENPLRRGLPFCSFKMSSNADASSPRFLALVLKTDESLSLQDGMRDVMSAWRVAFRMNDIQESRINILTDKKTKRRIDFLSLEKNGNVLQCFHRSESQNW